MTTGCLKRLTSNQYIHKWSVFVLFLILFFVRVSLCKDDKNDTLEEESAQFDVKPGGQVNEYTREWVRVIYFFFNSLIQGTF